ncbi:Nucleotidyltransferase [Panus rudis PR-1116 ss-1]|nr:Nucleotidyltransferase [Panus rudis PR-1116 ss-1]
MPFKRPAPPPHATSSGYSSKSDSALQEGIAPSKRSRVSRSAKALPDVKVYIIQTKLDSPTIAELFGLAERNCEKICGDPEEADVIITAIRMRRRLERHIPWDVATSKAIVLPDWLRDSVKAGKPLPCGDYTAVKDLHESTLANCPDCNRKPCDCEDTDYDTPQTSALHMYPSPPSLNCEPSVTEIKASTKIPANLLPPLVPIPTNLGRLSYTSKYACQRASPLICPNQDLAVELDIIRRSRGLEGEERSALSYARAISTIKAYPYRITSRAQVEKLPHIGIKIASLIEEFIDTHRISEARKIFNSERFKTLSEFSSIYGIGPNTARRLYNLNLRKLEELEIYYGVDPTEEESQLVEIQGDDASSSRWTRAGERGNDAQKTRDDSYGESWIKTALALRHDLAIKIPRDEVEEMNRVIMRELESLEPGCVSTIVGGYRRGKPESNDVDIVFTHPDRSKVKGLCKRLVHRLYEQGMVSHVMHLSDFRGHNPLRTVHWDSLEKALTVFTLPKASPFYKGIRRRLDLIFALPEVYWTAVIGWSGSIMFQRDLRQWAKDRCGMKFDSSGITRRYDSKPFFPKTEKEVFDLFGLEWVDPVWRNADV